MAEDQKSCIVYPNGIFGCSEYDSIDSCKKCQTNYYLEESVCVLIEDEKLVDHCIIHDEPEKCEICGSEYFLEENVCVKSEALNCLTVESLKKCDSCSFGYGLKTDEEFTNCVPKTDSNCLDSSDEFPFECSICSTDYYPNEEGLCISVTTPINNCLYYESGNKCSKCEIGKVLNSEQTKCVSNEYLSSMIDFNCSNNFMPNQPVCETC